MVWPRPTCRAARHARACAACRLQKGTTYNSYLIFGEKTALVDASHEKFRETYIPVLQQQLRAAGRKLDYIIVSHTEPDHSGGPLSTGLRATRPARPELRCCGGGSLLGSCLSLTPAVSITG